MHDLNYYVLNRDKRARWNDDHIMGLAPRPLPKTSQQAFQQFFARGHALFLPDDSDRVLDALDPSTHDLPPKNWTVQFPPNWEALPSDNLTRINCETFIVRKQKAEQEHTDHQQTAAAAALSTAAQPPMPPLPQLPYSTYPITYPIVPFPSQLSIFLPQHPTSSPPIATLTPVPAAKLSPKSQLNERAEKLLGICYQCNTLNPDKVTTEASLHLPVDCAPSFVLEKIEEGMGVNTVEHMEKALHELRDCLSRARTNKKLYIINMKPGPKAEDLGKRGKGHRNNTVNNAIQSNPASEQYTLLEKQWGCQKCGGHCWPHARAKGKHLHLSNAMLSLWAQQWTDSVPGVDLYNPPTHHWFDVPALGKQTKAINEKQRRESKKRKRSASPPRTPTKSKATTTPSPPVKKAKADVMPAKQQPEKETIILSSDPITPEFLYHRASKVGTEIINLSSSPTPGPSKKAPVPVFNLCSSDDFPESDTEHDELEP
ncbi:uncharacterized protein EI90DRAFT_3124911 [Cantharellus anzutake]|uniref:uncharacterized protein n=1 Tax=Cantharellus anzutake TaxID=1750568 RepID=UPI0019052AE0|nr:uncharacterized protein EI90DRAFT_3124911 [Cantharellus anzutake]KAF8329678.1 hypothetical protein EI90DRAFT_3124911 [Cantharellus anzutake]